MRPRAWACVRVNEWVARTKVTYAWIHVIGMTRRKNDKESLGEIYVCRQGVGVEISKFECGPITSAVDCFRNGCFNLERCVCVRIGGTRLKYENP